MTASAAKSFRPASRRSRRAVARYGFQLTFTDLPWGCDYYLKHGRMMDEDGFERLAAFDAIYLGAIGAPASPITSRRR